MDDAAAAADPPEGLGVGSLSREVAALLRRWDAEPAGEQQLLVLRREIDRRLAARASHGLDEVPPPLAPAERVVTVRPRAVLTVLGLLLAVLGLTNLVTRAQAGLTLVAIALFLALALNAPTEFFQRRGLRRPLAVLAVVVTTLGVLALLLLVLVPPLVAQVSAFVDDAPRYADELSKGNGPAGLLERKYQVVEQLRTAVSGRGLATVSGAALSGLTVVKGVVSSVVSLILIGFLTLFMLLEGPAWRRRLTELIPAGYQEPAERVGSGIYRAVVGFVTGNLLASLIAGAVAVVLLLATSVPYALPLGLFTVVVELVPYLGPVLVTGLLSLIALTQGRVPALVVLGVLVAYHLLEGHTLRPMIYGRALKLSPLAVLISILLGTEIAGILGALLAIPLAGSVQVVLAELLARRGSAPSLRAP